MEQPIETVKISNTEVEHIFEDGTKIRHSVIKLSSRKSAIKACIDATKRK